LSLALVIAAPATSTVETPSRGSGWATIEAIKAAPAFYARGPGEITAENLVVFVIK
jgi:hypothetical protein